MKLKIYKNLFSVDEASSLEKNILQRANISSLIIISFYSFYNLFNEKYTDAAIAAVAFLLYAGSYLYIANTKRFDIAKKIVISMFMLSIVSGFFNQGGFFGVTALNLCGLLIIISAIFSGIERRFFTTAYINMVLFFVWVHLYKKEWIHDYRSQHPDMFLIAETLFYIFYILYIGYLYKSEYDKNRQMLIETNKQLEEANVEISAQNDHIMAYNLQLKALINELEGERNKVLEANRDLLKANLEVARQNEYITNINTRLESIVAERTKDIKLLNKKIINFAQYNAHRVRGPLARIMGLLHIMNIDFTLNKSLNREQSEFYIETLRQNANDLDEMVRGVSVLLSDSTKLVNDDSAKEQQDTDIG